MHIRENQSRAFQRSSRYLLPNTTSQKTCIYIPAFVGKQTQKVALWPKPHRLKNLKTEAETGRMCPKMEDVESAICEKFVKTPTRGVRCYSAEARERNLKGTGRKPHTLELWTS